MKHSRAAQSKTSDFSDPPPGPCGDTDRRVDGSKSFQLSYSGAKAWLYREVSGARLGAIVKVDPQSEQFRYDIDERALQRARLNDGKLLLLTK